MNIGQGEEKEKFRKAPYVSLPEALKVSRITFPYVRLKLMTAQKGKVTVYSLAFFL